MLEGWEVHHWNGWGHFHQVTMGTQGLPFIHIVLNSFLAINHRLENHGMMIESLLISQRLETLSIVALDIQLIPHHYQNDHHFTSIENIRCGSQYSAEEFHH